MSVWKPLTLTAALACGLYGTSGLAEAAEPSREQALARISEHRNLGQWLDALAEVEQLQKQYPHDDFLYQLQVLTLSDIGNAGLAWQLYRARPQLFEPAQQQRLEAEYLSKLVNWSLAQSQNEENRLDEANIALAHMQQMLEHAGMQPGAAPLRIRYDRLVLLNRLGQHAQVREEYKALLDQGQSIPAYVLPAVGNSLMASEHPKEAIPVLEAAIRNEPRSEQLRSELSYAYLESGKPRKAIDWLKQWRDTEAPFGRLPDARESFQNWARYEADMNLAMIRAYSDDLPAAQREMEELADNGPGNGGLQSSLGTIYLMRGWPRRALQQHQMAHTLDPREVQPRIGQYEAYVELQRDDLARRFHDDLLRLYPNQPAVQRMHRHWKAHKGWQLYAYAEAGRSRGGDGLSPLADRDRHQGLELQSPVIADRWRLVAFADHRNTEYADQEVKPLRVGGGLRYRFGRMDAEALFNRPNDRIGGTGVRAGLGWQFNDRWHLGVSMARNDDGASTQARAAGIDADSMGLDLAYQRNERTSWSASASRFRYADGNRRDSFGIDGEQRLFTRPTFLVNGLASASMGRGRTMDVPYFNPEHDGMAEVGLRLEHQTWEHYENHFRQQLTIAVGNYWQRGYDRASIPRIEYRHEWQFGVGKVFEYGVSWSKPVYDGQRERHIGLDAAIHWGQ